MNSEKIWKQYFSLQENKKVVHCMTNYVTVNDCANILLAAGASPTMAHHIEEVEEITSACDALVCNLGATEYYESMKLAYQTASRLQHPIVIDPVGVGASAFRREYFKSLVAIAMPTCIRGNYAEIEALYQDETTTVGVDAMVIEKDIAYYDQIIKALAQKYKCIIVASGKTDIVSDGKNVYHIDNGNEMMTRITGAGCMSTCMIAAHLSLDKCVEKVLGACVIMGCCGQMAADRTIIEHRGTVTFRDYLIDSMYILKQDDIQPRVSHVEG